MIILLVCLSISGQVFAHSGRTDKNGGHKDNKNASGLGSYHYHCGGYPPHLHENGACPYRENGADSSDSSITKNVEPVITKEKVTLKKYPEELFVGDSSNLEFDIESDGKKDYTITSSDSSVASITGTTLKGISTGNATITVSIGSESSSFTVMIRDVPVESIEVEPSLELLIGDHYQIEAKVQPAHATDQTLSYSSSDSGIAQVDENGMVTGMDLGEAIITVTASNNVISETSIVVKEVEITSIVPNADTLNLFVGEEFQLEAQVLPENAKDKSYKITIDKPEVAQISEEGKVLAISNGEAFITMETLNGIKTQVTLKVENKKAETIEIDDSQINYLKDHTIEMGEEVLLGVKIQPSNATNQEVIWKSDNEKVIKVADGKFEVVGKGKVTLTASVDDASSSIELNVIKQNKKGVKATKGSSATTGIVLIAMVGFLGYRKKKSSKRFL